MQPRSVLTVALLTIVLLFRFSPVFAQDVKPQSLTLTLAQPAHATLNAGEVADFNITVPAGLYRIRLERQLGEQSADLPICTLSVVDEKGNAIKENVLQFADGEKAESKEFIVELNNASDLHLRVEHSAPIANITVTVTQQDRSNRQLRAEHTDRKGQTPPDSSSQTDAVSPYARQAQLRPENEVSPKSQTKETWEQLYAAYCKLAAKQGVDLSREEDAMMKFIDAQQAFAAGRYNEVNQLLGQLQFPRGPGYLAGDIARMWQALAEVRLQAATQDIQRDPQLRRMQSAANAELNKKHYQAAANIYKQISALMEAAVSVAHVQIATQVPVDLSNAHHYRRPGLTPNIYSPLPDAAWSEWQRIETLHDACDWQATAQGLERFVSAYPNTELADYAWLELVRIAQHHVDSRDLEGVALQSALQVLRNHPQTDRLQYQLAMFCLDEGQLQKGADLLEDLYGHWAGSDYANYGLLDAALALISLAGLDKETADTNILFKAQRLLQIASRENPDPYFHLNVLYAMDYVKPGLNYRQLLEDQERLIENPATPMADRVEARNRARVLHGIVPPNRDLERSRVKWRVHIILFKRRGPVPSTITRLVAPPPGSDQLTELNIKDIKDWVNHFKEDVWRMSRGSIRCEPDISIVDEAMPLISRKKGTVWADYGNHPLFKAEPIPEDQRVSVIMMAPMAGLPLEIGGEAYAIDMKTGIGKSFVSYVPSWQEAFEATLIHEWLHHVDSAFIQRGWDKQWNLAWLHCYRDWTKRTPMPSDAKWMVGYVSPLGRPVDYMDYYRYILSANITPRMWEQARRSGADGSSGAMLP